MQVYPSPPGTARDSGASPIIVWSGPIDVRKLERRRKNKEISSGADLCHFMNFANDVNRNVPRTTKTELRAGLHRTRSMERHKALISTRHASQIVLESFDLPPQSSHSAPEELLGVSQETRHLPTEPLRPSGRSKVRPNPPTLRASKGPEASRSGSSKIIRY